MDVTFHSVTTILGGDNVAWRNNGANLMNRSCYLTLGIFLASLVLQAGAQQAAAAKNRPSDVDTVDHLVTSLYDVISGSAGKPRDWDRFRSLFLPDGRLGVI